MNTNNPELLVISTSLRSESRSRLLAKAAFDILSASKETGWIDLQDVPLPFCDGGSAYGDPNVAQVSQKIKHAKCILVATPIYNFDVNAAFKNLIELTGKSWEDKTVGFLCAAGGKSSYMSVMAVANSLMLDFRTMIIPRFVYADGEYFQDDALTPAIKTRVEELCTQTIKLSAQLYPAVKV